MKDINKLKEFFLSNRAATTAYESTNEQSEDAVDTITMDVPLFIRMLEYAREDAAADVDLHDITEKAIALSKEVNVLQMEDYDEIIGANENISEIFVSPGELKGSFYKDILDLLDGDYKDIEKKDAASILRNILTSVNTQAGGQNNKIDTLKIKPNTDLGKLERGFYKAILDLLDDDYKGIEKKDAAEALKNIFTSVNAEAGRENLKERIAEVLNKINEELCPAGKAYVERRKKPKSKGGGGEEHSAYLMGRASKVCKGKMSGKKKKK